MPVIANVRMKMAKFLLIVVLAIIGMTAFATTNTTLDGVFMLSKQAGFQWDTIELKNGRFRLWHSSDVVIHGEQKPLEGTYNVASSRLVLGSGTVYSIRTVKSQISLWAPRAVSAWQDHRVIDVYGIFLPVENLQSDAPDLKSVFTEEEWQRSMELIRIMEKSD